MNELCCHFTNYSSLNYATGPSADVAFAAFADLPHLPARIAQCGRDCRPNRTGHHSVGRCRDDDRLDDTRFVDADERSDRSRAGTASTAGQVPRRRKDDDGLPVAPPEGIERLQWTSMPHYGRPKHLLALVPHCGRRRLHDRVPRLDSHCLRRPLVYRPPLAGPTGFRLRVAFRLRHRPAITGRLSIQTGSSGLPVGL